MKEPTCSFTVSLFHSQRSSAPGMLRIIKGPCGQEGYALLFKGNVFMEKLYHVRDA